MQVSGSGVFDRSAQNSIRSTRKNFTVKGLGAVPMYSSDSMLVLGSPMCHIPLILLS